MSANAVCEPLGQEFRGAERMAPEVGLSLLCRALRIGASPVALTAEFGGNAAKITQWNAFLKKSRLEGEALGSVTSRLASFLGPIVFSGNAVTLWKPATGWSTAKP